MASSVMIPQPGFTLTRSGVPTDAMAMREARHRENVARTEQPGDRAAMEAEHISRIMQMPPAAAGPQVDNRCSMPGRFSRSSSSSSIDGAAVTRNSFESRMQSPASSRTSWDSWDSSSRRVTYGYGWQKPAPIKQYRRRASPGELFEALPGEVLELILLQLRRLHLNPDSTSCATCHMRDLCSIAVSSRKFLKFARTALYEDIQLIGPDSQFQKKRYKINHGSRLILLRRTLRTNPEIAALVHNLKAPSPPQGMPLEEYHSLIASVIMACPNFERLYDPLPNYNHEFNRLFHALSTRDRLKEMTLVVEPSSFQRQRRVRASSSAGLLTKSSFSSHAASRDMLPQDSEAMLELNMRWAHLTTLTVQCLTGATIIPGSLSGTALKSLPALRHLNLSHLPFTAFDDNDLLSLPPLESLFLSYLPGVTCTGLSSFATRHSSQTIKKLTLQHLSVRSLPALARIFSNLISLETFSFVSTTAPVLSDGEMIWLFPYLACRSLRKLHWDITTPAKSASTADTILAKSIAAHGFPALGTLRTPNDPEGIFQNLCRPVDRIELPSDRYIGRGLIEKATSTGRGSETNADASSKAQTIARFPEDGNPQMATSLHEARLAAQNRLETARGFPRYFVNVIDEDGTVLEKYGMAGFMGEIGSKIRYELTPDDGGRDENGGLVEVSDLLADGGEDLKGEQGCTGRWQVLGNNSMDKKDRDRWQHTERGRWRAVSLS